MKKIGIILSLMLLVGVLVLSCNKEKTFDDNEGPTPATIMIPSHFPPMDIPEDNPMTEEGIALGRKLFWDTKLSGNNTMSCGSCHSPEAAFSENNQFSQGITGAFGNRNSMALINLGWQQFFLWDGGSATLEDQIFRPVTDPIEMADTWPNVVSKLEQDPEYPSLFKGAFGEPGIDSVKVSKAIAQFLRTMISGNSDFDILYKFNNGFQLTSTEMDRYNNISFEAKAGYGLFESQTGADCIHCHQGPLIQIQAYSNNGLDLVHSDLGRGGVTGNAIDNGKFKVPTLRNIELTHPYMHDGRFATLEDAVFHYFFDVKQNSPNLDPNMEYSHVGGVGNHLSYPQNFNELVAFLRTMTDTEFINNPDFQDPN